jgi:hypothetical protein
MPVSALQSQLYKQMKKYKMIADGKDSRGYVIAALTLSPYSFLCRSKENMMV